MDIRPVMLVSDPVRAGRELDAGLLIELGDRVAELPGDLLDGCVPLDFDAEPRFSVDYRVGAAGSDPGQHRDTAHGHGFEHGDALSFKS